MNADQLTKAFHAELTPEDIVELAKPYCDNEHSPIGKAAEKANLVAQSLGITNATQFAFCMTGVFAHEILRRANEVN